MNVRKEWIEDIALKIIMKTLMNHDDLQKIVYRIMELQKAENTLIPTLERQLDDVRKAIDNIIKAIEMGVCTRSTKTRLEELEAEEERIKENICREHPKTIMLDDIQSYIDSIGSDFEGVASPKRKADARLCKISGKIE